MGFRKKPMAGAQAIGNLQVWSADIG